MSDPRAKIYGEHIDCDPSDLMEPYRLLGQEYADKKAAYEFLDDMKKVIFNQQKGEAERRYPQNGKQPSETYLDRMAYASAPYIEFIEKLNAARTDYLRTQANYLAESVRLELLRSLESSARAQLQRT